MSLCVVEAILNGRHTTTVIPIYGVRGCGIIYAKFLLGQFFGLHRYPSEKYIFSSYYIRAYISF